MRHALFASCLFLAIPAAAIPETVQDPTVCLSEIEQACAGLESKMETCLTERGDRLSAGCRDQLKSALAMMQDPTGPAACVPDVQKLCPDLRSNALSTCIAKEQEHFSAACQKYLQSARPAASGE